MGSKSSGGGSGGGGGGGGKKTTTGTTKPGTSGGFTPVKGTTNLKQATTTPKPSGGGSKPKTAADIGKELDKLLAAGPAPAPTPKKVSEAMNQPLSAAQSMAMAGNTGLTGISEAQANTIVEANKQLNKIFGDSRPETFQALGQTFGEVGSKYQRPANKEKYAEDMSTIAEGLAAGAKPFIGPQGGSALSFTNLGIKNEKGETILSKSLPIVTATPPTFGQLGGDIGRAFTGYDSIQYTDPTSNVPEMVRTPGMVEGLAKIAVPGSLAMSVLQDLTAKAKGYLFGEEEEEEKVAVDPRIVSGAYDAMRRSQAEELAPFESLVPRDINIEELTTTPISSTGASQPSSPRALGAESVGIDPMTGLPIRESDVPRVIDFSEQDQGGGGGGGGDTTSDTPPDTSTQLTDYQKMLQRYAQLAGFSSGEVDDIVRQYGANGGLMNLTRTIPPERGPMSQGVASLFKNK